MNSKERVTTTINHQEPDRVPTGEWGIDHDHVSEIIGRHTYWRNRKDSTIALWEGRRDEMVESMKKDYAELIEKLDYDLITVMLVPPKGYTHPDPPKKIDDGVWEDSQGNIYKYAASNDSIICVDHPEPLEKLSEKELENQKEELSNIDPTQFELIDYIADKFGDKKAIVCRSIDIYGKLMAPFGGDQSHKLILPQIAPDEIKKMYKPVLEWNKHIVEHCAEKDILIGMQGHDFCMNSGSFMNPKVLRNVYFPFMKMVNDIIDRNDMIPFFHCCGNTWDIIDDFIEVGYKGYQSIQKSAGMDTEKIKKEYGDKLTLWTGVQCKTLINGNRHDVEKEVNEYLDICMPGGGFIFGSTNSVQYGANTDNYLRALEIVRNRGVY